MTSEVGPVVVRQEGVLSGRPTFRGTHVQAEILFENLAAGYSIDEIVESFSTLDREDLRIAILEAGRMLMDSAPNVSRESRSRIDHGQTRRLGFLTGSSAVTDDFDRMGREEIERLFDGQ